MSTKLYNILNWCKQGLEVENYPYVGEIDINLTIGEVIKVGESYYSIGVLSHVKKIAGVREIKIDFESNSTDYKSNLTCPYCEYEDRDSCELSENDEEHECSNCGAIISYERIVTVEYNATPVKPPDIVIAKWV